MANTVRGPKVYVVLGMTEGGGKRLLHASWSLEAAEIAWGRRPGMPADTPPWRHHQINDVEKTLLASRPANESEVADGFGGFMIFEMQMPLMSGEAGMHKGDPVKQFACAVLEGDPSAQDAVRDILRL